VRCLYAAAGEAGREVAEFDEWLVVQEENLNALQKLAIAIYGKQHVRRF